MIRQTGGRPTKQEFEDQAIEDRARVALIHAAIAWNDKESNLSRLLRLNEQAAAAGAKIILNPEMAISGYSFTGRNEVAPLAETIPGRATEQFGELAARRHVYLAFGLPELDQATGVIYNAAVLIGPEGEVLGRARKLAPVYKENLWAARGNLPVLVSDTVYGKVGLLICADAFWYQPARLAALRGAGLLLVLANWPPQCHPPNHFWRARAQENGFYLLACNRTGTDRAMDCTQAQSFIINPEGLVEKQVQATEDAIVYGSIPLQDGRFFMNRVQMQLAARRTDLYTDIAMDVYSHFDPDKLLELPPPGPFTAASLQMRSLSMRPDENRQRMISQVDRAFEMAADCKPELRLLVLPELATTGEIANSAEALGVAEEIPGPTVSVMEQKARERNAYIVLGLAERDRGSFYNTAVIIGPGGLLGRYRKVHLSHLDRNWAGSGENAFVNFDIPFARVGLLLGDDLLFPECAEALAKRGADLICAPSLWTEKQSLYLWEARMVEMQTHLAIANQWGGDGDLCTAGESAIYGYARYPENRLHVAASDSGDEIVVLCLDPLLARQKRFLELADYDLLLRKNSW